MPGQRDVWNLVTSLSSLLRAPRRATSPDSTDSTSTVDEATVPATDQPVLPFHRRGRVRLAAVGTAAALVATGAVTGAAAHKTVTLDVDGTLTSVSTFAGSVDGLLEEADVDLASRDVVAPGLDTGLQDGDEVVVRRARLLTVLTDGEQRSVWTTALSADEALADLAGRGGDVRLVASRSGSRADLGIRLDLDGPVDVVVDGRTEQVEDASGSLEDLLTDLEITVGELDRVQASRAPAADGGRLTVVIQRVAAAEVVEVSELPFETVTEQTGEIYVGETRTAVEGVVGERTVVHRVITVDGVEESRMTLSDDVTRAPVTAVVQQGTKEKPAPPPAAPRAPRQSSSSPAASAPAAPAATVPGDVWAALAQCESGGNPTIVSSNGLYHGLYQFSVGTWQSVGGSGLPSQASPDEQTMRAQMLQARSGWGQWPHCSSKLGLR